MISVICYTGFRFLGTPSIVKHALQNTKNIYKTQSLGQVFVYSKSKMHDSVYK